MISDIIATLGSVVFAATGDEIANFIEQNMLESNGIEQTTTTITPPSLQTTASGRITTDSVVAVDKKTVVRFGLYIVKCFCTFSVVYLTDLALYVSSLKLFF